MGILGRARKMVGSLGGQPARSPQFYQVACVSGHRLRGERTEGYQALRCPTCGDGIFVLPRSPLPEPPASRPSGSTRVPQSERDPAPPPTQETGSFEDDLIALTDPLPESAQPVGHIDPDAEIDWTEPTKPVAPAAPSEPRPTKREPATADASRRPRPRPAASPVPAKPPVPRESWGFWARRNRTPLLTAGAVSLVVLALVVRQGRQRLEQLPRIAELGRTEGLAKLDAGEFYVAKRLLSDAAAAVDGLGGRVEGAEEIRQGAREAAIFTDLVPESLERIVEEAVTYRTDATPWSDYFRTHYRGRSVIIDAPVTEAPDPAKPGSTYQVDYRLLLGKGPRPDGRARIDLTNFALFIDARTTVGEQKPFGARLASLELDLGRNEWVIGLEADSGVFITHPRALEAVGWPTPESSSEEPQP